MTYEAVTQWLFDQIPNYQIQGGSAYKPGLDKIRSLLERIGNPHSKSKFVHIAGTNGKGSVANILASIFIENGYKTGLFTSPHIIDFRERIKIDGHPVSEGFVIDFVASHRKTFLELEVSFFEITAAMAFSAFEIEQCDIAIIETGLGGRLDATNVIIPELSIITNIGLEHTQFLGDTREKIAFEKAGIIKDDVPVVIGEKDPETEPVFELVAKERSTSIDFVDQLIPIETDLLGWFQKINGNMALKAIEVLSERGWKFEAEKVKLGIKNVAANTGFSGRMQVIGHEPIVILDVAHNKEGVETLLNEVREYNINKLHIVYGTSDDKDVEAIASIFPKNATFYLTTFDSKRSLSSAGLDELGRKAELNYQLFDQPALALSAAKESAQSDDLILVFGSFYLMESILSLD